MHRRRCVRSHAALTGVCLLSGCVAIDIDETDHNALFVEARVRKQLDGSEEHSGPHVELGWTSVQGETDALEYSIGAASLGAGLEMPVGEQGWVGSAAGIRWQVNDLDPSTVELEADDGVGPYIAFQGGWRATSWLEPYARAEAALYFNEYASTAGCEAGAHVYVIESTALFVGWRFAQYNIDDVDSDLGISKVELDASGLVVGLAFSF